MPILEHAFEIFRRSGGMVKIKNEDLEVSRDLFERAFDMYKRDGLSNTEAYYAACSYFENEGYRVKYSSPESWKVVANRKRTSNVVFLPH